jgi:hypothetical protein
MIEISSKRSHPLFPTKAILAQDAAWKFAVTQPFGIDGSTLGRTHARQQGPDRAAATQQMQFCTSQVGFPKNDSWGGSNPRPYGLAPGASALDHSAKLSDDYKAWPLACPEVLLA